MLNRITPPPFKAITNIKLPPHNFYTLDNGIPVYELSMGTQDVLKIELIFNAGRWYEHKNMVARTTASMLKEGTSTKSSADIAKTIDFYAGTLRFPSSLDNAHIVLYCLKKHVTKLLPIVEDILHNPVFPEDELNTLLQRKKSRLKIDLEKPDIVAYRQVTELMFGDTHPYGYNSSTEKYDGLHRDDLVHHFKETYTANKCKIIVSGKSDENLIKLLNKHLGAINRGEDKTPKHIVNPYPERILTIEKKDSLQSAIRVGRRLFNRKHPDFKKMYVLTTLLGGYFGSRLMQNLREDKGYTYGVYAAMESMRQDGDFFIGVEVGNEVMKPALKEIYHEFRRLREELVIKEELDMVKNYMLGSMLSALDGPFNTAEVLKTIIIDDLPLDYFNDMEQVIKNITALEIQEIANKYLQEKDYYEVIVGNKK